VRHAERARALPYHSQLGDVPRDDEPHHRLRIRAASGPPRPSSRWRQDTRYVSARYQLTSPFDRWAQVARQPTGDDCVHQPDTRTSSCRSSGGTRTCPADVHDRPRDRARGQPAPTTSRSERRRYAGVAFRVLRPPWDRGPRHPESGAKANSNDGPHRSRCARVETRDSQSAIGRRAPLGAFSVGLGNRQAVVRVSSCSFTQQG
jgi:hypothetical protein